MQKGRYPRPTVPPVRRRVMSRDTFEREKNNAVVWIAPNFSSCFPNPNKTHPAFLKYVEEHLM
jgi:hypothetical protein